MEARCKDCNSNFFMRNQRGNKLSNHRCKCGGKYERMNDTGKIYGESPAEHLSKTVTPYPTWPDQRKYYHTFMNAKGEHYFLDYANKKFIALESFRPLYNCPETGKREIGNGCGYPSCGCEWTL